MVNDVCSRRSDLWIKMEKGISTIQSSKRKKNVDELSISIEVSHSLHSHFSHRHRTFPLIWCVKVFESFWISLPFCGISMKNNVQNGVWCSSMHTLVVSCNHQHFHKNIIYSFVAYENVQFSILFGTRQAHNILWLSIVNVHCTLYDVRCSMFECFEKA